MTVSIYSTIVASKSLEGAAGALTTNILHVPFIKPITKALGKLQPTVCSEISCPAESTP